MNTETIITEPITTVAPSQIDRVVDTNPTPSGVATLELPKPSRAHRSHRLWGTIQTLPVRTRNWLNQSLRDGVPYKHIIAALEKKNRHISKQQLSSWLKSGYAQWLADQQFIETRKLHAEAVAASNKRADKSTRAGIRDVADLDIAVHLHDATRAVSLEELRNLFVTRPENFFRLIRAHAVHERNAIMRDRAALDLKKYIDASKKQKHVKTPKRGGVTAEKLEAIKARLNIM